MTIREVRPEDAAIVARLTGELGYPIESDVMLGRIQALGSEENRAVFVACDEDSVVGWIDVAIVQTLQSGRSGEVHGLVVSSECRSGGVGGILLEHAEAWIMRQGAGKVVVRSRVERERAHGFYLRRGYVRTKTSAVFGKEL